MAAPQSIAVGPDGVTVDSPLFRGADAWELYASFSETKHLFMLYLKPRMFRIVPKRAFSSAEQIDQFRSLIAQHLKAPPTQINRWIMVGKSGSRSKARASTVRGPRVMMVMSLGNCRTRSIRSRSAGCGW